MSREINVQWVLVTFIALIMAAPTRAQRKTVQVADVSLDPAGYQITRLYVSANAHGGDNGTTWHDAYINLNDALDYAESPDSQVQEIWVARGTYKPALPGGDRAVSFHLVGGVALYGGFAGSEDMLDQRDPSVNETILSGDLDRDDGLAQENTAENSFHVLTWSSDLGPSVLDGFVVTGGHADGTGVWPYTHGGGGGVLMGSGRGDFRLRNCTIRRNYALQGGGVLAKPDAVIEHCLFEDNNAEEGGAFYASYNVEVRNCRFVSNVATNGGAIYSFSYLSPRFVNSAFVANTADIGGAFYSDAYESEPIVVNCLFFGNHARVGGGIYRAGYNPRRALHLVNSILWANADEDGACEHAQVYWEDSRALTANDSCIQGWTGFIDGVGNFGFDPRFVDADGHDHEYGTSDDDFHLRADSPCINAGEDQAPLLPAMDLNGLPRIQECRVDLGACESPYFTDCNANTASDACDIAAGVSGDANSDGIPDECEPGREPIREQERLTAPDGQWYQRFGTAVAASQDTLVIGAPRHEDDGRNTGCAYVFRRAGSGWTPSGILRAADGGLGDRFGSSIALSGAMMVIGAPEAYDVGFRSGAAYVFHRGPAGWSQKAKLHVNDLAPGDAFGKSVAISTNEVVIGAPGRDEQGQDSGCAYLFRFDGHGWPQVANPLAPDGAAGDQFGSSVAIDKSSILIGSPGADVYAPDSGAAYHFRIERGLPTQGAKLVPPVGKRAERFGTSVALLRDRLIVGAASGVYSYGYAVVFQQTESGWLPTAKLQPSDRRLLDGFGQSVAFVGNDILVGAPMGFGITESSGCAYLFRFENEHWEETAKLLASDGAGYHRFGGSIAGSNHLVLIGAEQFGMVEGAVYVFDPQSIGKEKP